MVQLEVIAGGCSPGGHFGEIYVDGVGSTVPGPLRERHRPGAGQRGHQHHLHPDLQERRRDAGRAGVSVTSPRRRTRRSSRSTRPGLACTYAGASARRAPSSAPSPARPRRRGRQLPGHRQHRLRRDRRSSPPATTRIQGTGQHAAPRPQDRHRDRLHARTRTARPATGATRARNACTPKLANGTPVPNDPPHTGPTLNGTCTAAAGALVCASGVCDTDDNECGYAQRRRALHRGQRRRRLPLRRLRPRRASAATPTATGPAPTPTAASSAAPARAAPTALCEPRGGCNVDADCAGGNWCNETTHTLHGPSSPTARRPDRPAAHEPDAQRHVHAAGGGDRWSA